MNTTLCLIELVHPEAAQRSEELRQMGVTESFPLPPIRIRFATYAVPLIGDVVHIETDTWFEDIKITGRTFLTMPDGTADMTTLKLLGVSIKSTGIDLRPAAIN